MCERCWDNCGQPTNWTPQIADALKLVRELYAEHPTGGPLHTELDDWNIEGRFWPATDGSFDAATMQLAKHIATAFNAMPLEDRASVLAYHWRLAPIPGDTPGGLT